MNRFSTVAAHLLTLLMLLHVTSSAQAQDTDAPPVPEQLTEVISEIGAWMALAPGGPTEMDQVPFMQQLTLQGTSILVSLEHTISRNDHDTEVVLSGHYYLGLVLRTLAARYRAVPAPDIVVATGGDTLDAYIDLVEGQFADLEMRGLTAWEAGLERARVEGVLGPWAVRILNQLSAYDAVSYPDYYENPEFYAPDGPFFAPHSE